MTSYAEFILEDHHFQAFMPASGSEPHVWTLVVTFGGAEKVRREIPMFYPNLFGPDMADVADMEAVTEEVIKELGLEST